LTGTSEIIIAANADDFSTSISYVPSTRALSSSTGNGFTFPIFSSTLAGLVPLSGGGTSLFLRADASWSSAVTSVGGTGSVSGITLTGSVTESGNLTLEGTLSVVGANFGSQTANRVFAAPNGSDGNPSFRALVAADIPTLNQSTTGSAATLTTPRDIAMTGDVSWSVSFNGSTNVTAAGTIANDAVTYAKMQNVTANSVLARAAATDGDVSAIALAASQLFGRGATGDLTAITLGSGLSMSGSTLNAVSSAGKQTLYIPAEYMKSRVTNGPSAGFIETVNNRINLITLDFDSITQEFAQFQVAMPKSWDEGTVTFEPIWYHPSATTNFGVVWSLAGVALSDTNALDTAFGTAVQVTDTGGTTNALYDGPESAAVTIGNVPAENDYLMFQIARVPADAADTLATDARLLGIRLFYTTNAGNDA
jgi:hypothetical protein